MATPENYVSTLIISTGQGGSSSSSSINPLSRELALLKSLHAKRVAIGLCRHCGKPCPCWSREYGDVAPGRAYPHTL